MKRVIIIMAKVPRAGNVKTRLLPFLSAAQCESLAEAFLFDAVRKARPLCDNLIVAFAPAAERDYFARFDNENLILHEQTGADLGEKMFNAFEFAFAPDSDAKVLIIGTDSPTFPAEFVERAFDCLENQSAIVAGKSLDGGFYLLGLREISPLLFANIEWSSAAVYKQLLRNIAALNRSFNAIPEWFDVDTPTDLIKIRDEILSGEEAQKVAPKTFQWCQLNDL